MKPELAPLDVADERTVAAVQALRVAVEAAETPDFPPPCPHHFRALLTHPVSSRRIEHYVARLDGEVVGYLSIELPLRENLDSAEVGLLTHPAYRRRGVGRALHAYLRERLRELGRHRCVGMSVASLPGGPPRDEAGGEFASAMGAASALEDVRRRLDLTTLDESAHEAMFAQAQARATGYRLVTWRDRTPEEYAADVGYLDGRLVSDAPLGELKWEAPQIDVSRVREREAWLAASRVRVYSAGAVDERTGRLVALTAIGRQESSPWHAFQWITLVDPEHRGHRLGMLVKVANLRFARSHEPQLRVIDTWNAAVNTYMISINEAMGFRPVDRWLNWQQEL